MHGVDAGSGNNLAANHGMRRNRVKSKYARQWKFSGFRLPHRALFSLAFMYKAPS